MASLGHESESKDLLRTIDSIPSLIHTGRPDGYLDYFNQHWLEYVGLPIEGLLGWKWTAAIHPEDVEAIVDKWRHDGRFRWFLCRRNPLRDERGHITRWISTATDIEDRKQAEERLRHENVALREEIDEASMFEEIVGTSPALKTVLSRISKVAPSDSTVLITGETGTGKEFVARAIHRRSDRASRAFVSVNCAAIPRDLIASELFGHEKGAFTGAMERQLGRFELADGGTIFLDEVGELLPDTQVALLRALQEREFERVGGGQPIHVDVHVIAATMLTGQRRS